MAQVYLCCLKNKFTSFQACNNGQHKTYFAKNTFCRFSKILAIQNGLTLVSSCSGSLLHLLTFQWPMVVFGLILGPKKGNSHFLHKSMPGYYFSTNKWLQACPTSRYLNFLSPAYGYNYNYIDCPCYQWLPWLFRSICRNSYPTFDKIHENVGSGDP